MKSAAASKMLTLNVMIIIISDNSSILKSAALIWLIQTSPTRVANLA